MSKIDDFWKVKHQIDDEVKRLGWDTDRCINYVFQLYNKRSRLVLNDQQLLDLLERLKLLPTPTDNHVISKATSRRRKKRRN